MDTHLPWTKPVSRAATEGRSPLLDHDHRHGCDADRLIAGIEAALAAEQAQRSRESLRQELIERVTQLSPRQREVMQLVSEGLSNEQIALRLGISPRTVENYRAWVLERMGAASIADLVRKVLLIERQR